MTKFTTDALIKGQTEIGFAQIGMPVTEVCYSDMRVYRIIEISKSGKTAKVVEDLWKRTDGNGMSDVQKYEFSPNPNGEVKTIRMTKRGWYRKGSHFLIGLQEKYHDFSF